MLHHGIAVWGCVAARSAIRCNIATETPPDLPAISVSGTIRTSSMRTFLAVAVAASLLLSLLAAASATPPTEPPPKETDKKAQEAAMQILGAAKFYYTKGDFAEAAKLFHQAYRTHPRPEFLYNAARAEQRAADFENAKKHYTEVMRLKACPAKVAERSRLALKEIAGVEALIRKSKAKPEKVKSGSTTELEGVDKVPTASGRARAETKAAKEEAARQTAATSAPKSVVVASKPAKSGPAAGSTPAVTEGQVTAAPDAWKNTAALPTIGAGVVIAGVGGWLLSSWLSGQSELDALYEDKKDGKVVGIDYETYESRQTALNTDGRIAAGVTALGVVALGAGSWMLATAPKKADKAAWSITPTGRGALFTARF